MQESSSNLRRLAFPLNAVPADVGSVVSAERRRRRWSQARLAERSGLSRASIYRLEAGERPSRADTLFRVSHALDMQIRELVPDWPEWEPIRANGHGEAIRERRRSLDISLAELAATLGISEATLSRHERGICISSKLARRVGGEAVGCSDALAQALLFADPAAFGRYMQEGRGGQKAKAP